MSESIQHRRRHFSLMVDDRLELRGSGLAVLQLKVRLPTEIQGPEFG